MLANSQPGPKSSQLSAWGSERVSEAFGMSTISLSVVTIGRTLTPLQSPLPGTLAVSYQVSADTRVNRVERQVDTNAGDRHRFAGDDLELPGVMSVAPVAFDAPLLLVYDQIRLHAGQALLDLEFLGLIDADTTATEDLDDDAGSSDVHFIVAVDLAQLLVAEEHGVGVVVAASFAASALQADTDASSNARYSA